MEQLWETAKSLEGKTLYTVPKGAPFEVVEVNESHLKYRRQRTGKGGSLKREHIEEGCRHRLAGGEVTGTALYEAGIVRSDTRRSYLPGVILAITQEYERTA